MTAYQIAHLENDQSTRIHDLEEELDVCVLALEPGLELAELDASQLARVKEVEQQTGVTLVVYARC